MGAELLWELFTDTGAPEVYLMYRRASAQADAEETAGSGNVAQNNGSCPALGAV